LIKHIANLPQTANQREFIICSHFLGVADSKESQAAADVPSSSSVGKLGLNSDFDTQKLSNVNGNGKIKEEKTN